MVALHGCASAPTNNRSAPKRGEPTASAEQTKPQVELRKGMTPDEVRLAFGEPTRTQPATVESAEEWIYVVDRKTEVNQVVIGTHDVPYVDPVTGQTKMVAESTYSEEATSITVELHMIWRDGVLAGWTTERRRDRAYTK
jgi:hypothetical protein